MLCKLCAPVGCRQSVEASGHSIYAGPWVNYTDALSRIINIWVVSMAIYCDLISTKLCMCYTYFNRCVYNCGMYIRIRRGATDATDCVC